MLQKKFIHIFCFFFKLKLTDNLIIYDYRLDMCRRQYANDACNRGTAGNFKCLICKKSSKHCALLLFLYSNFFLIYLFFCVLRFSATIYLFLFFSFSLKEIYSNHENTLKNVALSFFTSLAHFHQVSH